MTMLIDGIDFHELEAMRYWSFPNSWDLEKKKRTVNERIFSDEWLGAQKRDGAFYKFIKSDNGEMELLGRSKSVSGDYLNKIDWVPQLHPFFENLPNGTCLLGEIYLPSNERAKSTTSIMNCLVDKAVKRQEKEHLHYYIFDILAYDGRSYLTYSAADRFEELTKCWRAYGEDDYEWAQYYSGKELWDKLQSLLADGYEGIVITREGALYQPGKRPSKDTLKVKKELQETIDCVIMGANPPAKFSDTKKPETWEYWFDERTNQKITAKEYWDKYNTPIYVAYDEGNPITPVTKTWFNGWAGSLKLGLYNEQNELIHIGDLSGITDEIKEHWKEYVGTVVEIGCMEISEDKDGNKGFRHPRAMNFRNDKDKKDCILAQIY